MKGTWIEPALSADQQQLLHDVSEGRHLALLRQLGHSHEAFRQFESWTDVIDFVSRLRRSDEDRDPIVRPILHARSCEEDRRWQDVSLAVFWSDLRSLFYRYRRLDPDGRRLWGAICWSFFGAVEHVDLERRRIRVSQKIYNDTAHALRAEYREGRLWRRAQRIDDDEDAARLVGATYDAGIAEFEDRDEREVAALYLASLATSGRISEEEFWLLLGTRVYNKSVARFARERGLGYDATKKRRQRAEARIRSWLRK